MASAPSLELCDHFRDNRCPSRLVTRTDAGTAAAIEILIEEEEITPFGIVLEQLDRPVEWPLSIAITPENANQSLLKFQRNVPEIQFATRARRELHLEIIAEIVGKFCISISR